MSNSFANKHVCMATIGNSNRGMAFSVQSMSRCYKQDSSGNEFVVRQQPATKDGYMEVEKATVLEAVTRRQLVKTKQTNKT
jgi:hypothetical protein